MKETYVLLICLAVSSICFSQNFKTISGKVVDGNDSIIIGAVVTEISLLDSTWQNYAVTDTSGFFRFETENKLENSVLEVSMLGFQKLYISLPQSMPFKAVLKVSLTELETIVVRANKSTFKRKPGKFIYTPRGAELGVNNTLEVLRYTPLLTVGESSISILGKGNSTIYINGRKPVMSQKMVMEVLRSTPPDQIEKIEVITTLGSTHKASTTGGIINVVINQAKVGWIGSATASVRYSLERFSPDASLYLGYSKERFKFSTNLMASNYSHLRENDIFYDYKSTGITINNSNRTSSTANNFGGSINASYDLTPKSVLGASLAAYTSNSSGEGSTYTDEFLNGIPQNKTLSESSSNSPFSRPSLGATLYYKLTTDKKGSNLDVSVNYSYSYGQNKEQMQYSKILGDGKYEPYSIFNQGTEVGGNGFEAKATYLHYFEDKSRISGGYEINISNLSNNFLRQDFDFSTEQFVGNTTLSNHFVFDETINALYASYDRSWSDIFSSTLGLRLENTYTKSNQVSTGGVVENNYLNLFPSVSLNLDLADGDHSIALDGSRYITRPFYSSLNQFKIWTSENTYTVGNPLLKPMISNDLTLVYTLKGDYIFGVYYSYGTDAFSDYTYKTEDNKTVTSTANFGEEHYLSFYFDINKVFFNGIWRLNINGSVNYDNFSGAIESSDIGYSDWSCGASVRNTIQLSKKYGWLARASYSYRPPFTAVTRVYGHKHVVSLSIDKEFKYGGQLSFSAFNLTNYRNNVHYNSPEYYYNRKDHTNNIMLQLRYSHFFGRKKQVQGAQDRSNSKYNNRIK